LTLGHTLVDALRTDWRTALISDAEGVMIEYVVQITEDATRVTPTHHDRLRASVSGGVRLPEQVGHQLLVAARHELGLARAAGAHDVEAHRAHAGVERATHVGTLVVANVKDLLRGEAERFDRSAEDLGARLGVPDVHRVDRGGEEVARAVLLEQSVLGAP